MGCAKVAHNKVESVQTEFAQANEKVVVKVKANERKTKDATSRAEPISAKHRLKSQEKKAASKEKQAEQQYKEAYELTRQKLRSQDEELTNFRKQMNYNMTKSDWVSGLSSLLGVGEFGLTKQDSISKLKNRSADSLGHTLLEGGSLCI